MFNSGILEEEEFEQILKSNKPVLIDFSATWCGPCRMMAPIAEDVSDELKGKIDFYQVDVDSNPSLAEKFAVQFVPTFVILSQGKEIARKSGYMEKQDFKKFISEEGKIK